MHDLRNLLTEDSGHGNLKNNSCDSHNCHMVLLSTEYSRMTHRRNLSEDRLYLWQSLETKRTKWRQKEWVIRFSGKMPMATKL